MNLLVVLNDPIFELTKRYSLKEIEEFFNPKMVFDQVHLISLFDTQDYRSKDVRSLVIHPMGLPPLKGNLLQKFGQSLENIYRGVRAGLDVIKKNNVDIIRNKNSHEFGMIGTLISKMTGRRYVQSLHNDDDTRFKITKSLPVYYYKHILETFNIKNAAKVIGISNYLAKYAKLHGAKSVTCIPNPVDIKLFLHNNDENVSSKLKEELGVSGKMVLLNVSRYGATQKNVKRLLVAFSRLPKDLLKRSVLCIIGDGCGKEEEYRRLVEDLKIDGNTLFLGIILYKKIPPYLKLADIYVNPTLFEGFNFALVEALASGLPVLTSNHPVPMENVDISNGVVVNPYSVDEIRDGLEYLMRLSERERRKLGDSSRKKALRFDRNKIFEEEAKLYRSILA